MPDTAPIPHPRSDDRRQRILDAALAAFDEQGYEATTIDDIRARSGASIGSIYHHFGDKASLAATLYEEALAQYREGMLARAERATSARSLVRGIVVYHLEWAATHPVLARYLMRNRHADGVLARDAALRQGTVAFLRAMHAHLTPHVDRGEVVRMPASLYSLVLLGPAHEMLRRWLAGELALDPRSVANTLADLAWKALRADAPARRGRRGARP
jgi:AcrR family transcriptional regulator